MALYYSNLLMPLAVITRKGLKIKTEVSN